MDVGNWCVSMNVSVSICMYRYDTTIYQSRRIKKKKILFLWWIMCIILHISRCIIKGNDTYETLLLYFEKRRKKICIWNIHGRLQFHAILTQQNEERKKNTWKEVRLKIVIFPVAHAYMLLFRWMHDFFLELSAIFILFIFFLLFDEYIDVNFSTFTW